MNALILPQELAELRAKAARYDDLAETFVRPRGALRWTRAARRAYCYAGEHALLG